MGNLDDLRQFLQAVQTAHSASRTAEEFAQIFREAIHQQPEPPSGPPQESPAFVPELGHFDIPLLLPDELLQGWLGRIMVLNGFKRDRAERLIRAYALQLVPTLNSNADLVDCVSTIFGMTRDELLRRHTLTPFFNALVELKQTWKPGQSSRHRAAYRRHAPFRTDGRPARLCRHCVEEDLAAGKVSYWRRGHQLPGAYSCDKHFAPLLIAGGAEAFDRCPHHYFRSLLSEESAPAEENARAILQRYMQLAAELLGSAPTINSLAASTTLGNRAKMAGLRISRTGRRKTLSTHAMESLPLEWLQRTFHRVIWETNKYISSIDGACSPGATRYTSITFCLIAALLYDDADQAILELVNAEPPVRDRFGTEFWASEEVLDVYCAKNGVVSHIANALGLPSSSVSLGLLNQGLPGLGKCSASLPALNAFYAGQPLDEACREHHADRNAVEALIRVNGARFAAALTRMQPPKPNAD